MDQRVERTKFKDPAITAKGEPRATVTARAIRTLWVNTGTLCNLTCRNCYIESSPKNDSLVYISTDEVAAYLDECEAEDLGLEEIGFTGGEPFMNPQIMQMLALCLERGYRVLVLTNAMKPFLKRAGAVRALGERFAGRLTLRVSVDHYSKESHEAERGAHSWERMLKGLKVLKDSGLTLSIAGRTFTHEPEDAVRAGFAHLFAALDLPLDAYKPADLMLFPEMDETADVPEITTACWGILDVDPANMMCASSRMVIKRKGADGPTVVACTLLPYDPQFDMGTSLAASLKPIALNHPHCARFCVLGGASCTG